MFKFPSIRQKIMLGYYAGVVVLILISVFTLTELWYMEKKVQFGGVISDFFDTTLEIRRFEKNFFLYQQNDDYQENMSYVSKALGILDQNIDEYKRLSIASQMDSIRERLKKYKLLMTQFAVDSKNNSDKRLDLEEEEIRILGKEIVTIAEDVSKTERKRLQALLIKTQRTLVFLIVFLSFAGIVIGQLLSRMVVKPLQSLEEQMKLIEKGKLRTVLINSKDREIVSLTDAFNKMLNELEFRQKHLIQREKLASLGTLLSGVAHELNNPLSNISSSCEILTEELEDTDVEFKKELLSQIVTQTDRARDIVRSLLEFSRHREFKKEILPLKKLFEETNLFLKGDIPAGIEITMDIPDDIYIFADKQRIQQAFLNLLKNAMESIADEGKVSVMAQKHFVKEKEAEKEKGCDYAKYRDICTGECPVGRDTIDIEIKDTGAGIPPDILPKIFDPFFTTKDVEKDSESRLDIKKGSGLGLYVVEEIIEENDGCIGVYSEVGKGTSFLIRLPMKKA
ncbi:MAG: ATP-binding protein [Nitrospirota bacterium]